MNRKEGIRIRVRGNGLEKTLPLAAKYAVEWNGVCLNHSDFKERCDLPDKYLETDNLEDVERSMMTGVVYRRDDPRVNARLANESCAEEELIERGRVVVGTGSEVVDHSANGKKQLRVNNSALV